MDNPHEQPAPADPIARVQAFARDLAWGAVNGKWGSEFSWRNLDVLDVTEPENYQHATNELILYIQRKWFDGPPSINLMRSFEYFTPAQESLVPQTFLERSFLNVSFLLTPKAFALLNKPAVPPKIFISYRQAESSAFASLIEARLNIAAPEAGVFIDKLLEGGEEWEQRIKKEICERDTFILVYGKTTHESTMIPKEITWARKSGSRIIPVLHNGYRGGDNYPEELNEIQWIAVETEKAEYYELAILKLLNTLGYSTLQSPHPSASTS